MPNGDEEGRAYSLLVVESPNDRCPRVANISLFTRPGKPLSASILMLFTTYQELVFDEIDAGRLFCPAVSFVMRFKSPA
jgi:hypothetical protein